MRNILFLILLLIGFSFASNIDTTYVKEGKENKILNLTGIIISSPNGSVNVTSSVNGVIVRVLVNIGQHVHIGQPLFIVKSADVANLYSNYLQAKAQYELALKTYDLTKKLYEIGSASKFDLENAFYNLKSSKALMNGYLAQMKIIGIKPGGSYIITKYITSPANGTVAQLNIHPGEHIIVDPYTPLATIVNTSHVMAVLNAFDRDIRFINKGESVDITSDSYPGLDFKGKVMYVGDILDPNTKTYKVYVNVQNKENFLKPNMFIRGKVFAFSKTSLYVPQSSLILNNGQFYVYKLSNGKYIKVPVKVSEIKDGKAYISAGLNPGDVVVSNGSILLQNAGE